MYNIKEVIMRKLTVKDIHSISLTVSFRIMTSFMLYIIFYIYLWYDYPYLTIMYNIKEVIMRKLTVKDMLWIESIAKIQEYYIENDRCVAL
jgi:hypothetical protein